MKELLQLIRKSKTAKSGIVTIVWGILILFGVTEGPPPQTIDGLGHNQSGDMEKIVGIGALGSGLMTLKGRNDVEKRIKEKNNG
jgi:hypothetical protein